MIPDDKVKVLSSGTGYLTGELTEGYKYLEYLRPGALICRFEGVDNMFDFMEKNMPNPQRDGHSSNTDRDTFNAFSTYEEAMDTFRNKPETVVKFDAAELRIKDDSEVGSRVEYEVTGDYIDMGRYMEGVPETMGQMHAGNARNRRVNIMIDLNQIWSVKPEEIIHRGERILRLVDALEAGGIRSQIIGYESNECGHTEIVLKRHDEPLTISDLAVVSHSEFLRRIIFRVNEHSKTWTGGYGMATQFGRAVDQYPEQLLDTDNINEMNIFVGANLYGISDIDRLFNKLERLLVWEMSKPVPEVIAVKLSSGGISFSPNGARSEEEIKREGMEVMEDE